MLVTSPDFPLVTFGEDEATALGNAVDAAEAILASMIEAKEEIPEAPSGDDGMRLRLPLRTILKAELYLALRRDGISRAELQRRLGWQRESVDRLFRLDHNSRIEQLDQAFKALGKEVGVEIAA